MRSTLHGLDAIIQRIIGQRRATGEDHGDLLSTLVQARDELDGQGMSDRQLRDAAGNILSNRSVSWSSTDNSVVMITSANGSSATILAQAAGLASLRATSEGKTGEASISVAAAAPVATVTVVPDTATLAVGDSARFFRADLRDAAGNLLRNRTVSWSTSDPSVISVSSSGAQALVQPRAVGSAFLRATSEGKTGQASITVH